MAKLAGVALLALACVTVGLPGAASGRGAPPVTYTVTIENMQFNPANLSVHHGDRILWLNKDLFPHTATANDKTFDSGNIDPGGSWAFEVKNDGDHAYGCSFHPTMKGTLHVR